MGPYAKKKTFLKNNHTKKCQYERTMEVIPENLDMK